MSAYRWLFSALSPAGPRARLTVLIYHRVLRESDPLRPGEPTASAFEERMRWVKARFNVIPLTDAIAGLKRGSLPERPLSITFDDGYRDNFEIARPILEGLGLPATFFVAAGYLDGGIMFNDRVIESMRGADGDTLDLRAAGLGEHRIGSLEDRSGAVGNLLQAVRHKPLAERSRLVDAIVAAAGATLPRDLMMTSEQVATLHRGGMEVGAHTLSHPILARTPRDVAMREIEASKKRLEELTGNPVRLFAYPNGKPHADYTAEHVALVRELGFDGAVSTAWGVSSPGADPFQVPRFTPWGGTGWKLGLRFAQNLRRSRYETV